MKETTSLLINILIGPKLQYLSSFVVQQFQRKSVQQNSAESNNTYSIIACLSWLQAEHLHAFSSTTQLIFEQ